MDATVVHTLAPSEELLADRRRIGLENFHEVWDGVHHLRSPGPPGRCAFVTADLLRVLAGHARDAGLVALGRCTMGTDHDCRIPPISIVRSVGRDGYLQTAALVAEVVTPGDESWLKFDFYAAHGVDEVLLADPQTARLHWFRLVDGSYAPTKRSEVLDVDVAEVHAEIDWRTDRA